MRANAAEPLLTTPHPSFRMAPCAPPLICALIDRATQSSVPPWIAANEDRLRQHLIALDIMQINGLGDIPPGASVLFVRADALFERAALASLASQLNCGVRIDDQLAAIHVDAGDAAAALSKFRRRETSGWAPFQIQFLRAQSFAPRPQGTGLPKSTRLQPLKLKSPAKAALLPAEDEAAADRALDAVWAASPGLDGWVRPALLTTLQKRAFDRFKMTQTEWRCIGAVLGVGMIACAYLQGALASMALGLLAANCFDIAERAHGFKGLHLTCSVHAPAAQSLLLAAFWLSMVLLTGASPAAIAASVLLMALPVAFIVRHRSVRVLSPSLMALFGIYSHWALANVSVLALALSSFPIAASPAAALSPPALSLANLSMLCVGLACACVGAGIVIAFKPRLKIKAPATPTPSLGGATGAAS